MLKNKKTVYFCQECGYESAKWMGQCPGCKSWNTFVEETVSTKKPSSSGAMKSSEKRQEPVILKDISLSEDERQTTQIGELDRVLGGGIIPGSLVLVGGDPGIGKSTLLLQVCRNLAEKQVSVLYISGEESLRQIKLRANRIGQFTDKMQLLCETNLEVIREVIERRKPDVVVIDSIQTMFHEDVSSAPGSVSQVRESTNILMQIAKGMGVSIFIVGHVTKEGNVAGPRVLEHMVDTVLYFEGDRHASYRILRAVKNRFGSTNEIGVFEMCNTGLEEVKNPSEYMLNGRPEDASGSVVACSMEGTRPILVEIQALVCQSNFGIPRRTAAATEKYHQLGDSIKAAETRMAEIAVLKTHIVNYAKTHPVYDAYRKAGYSKKFLDTHREEITLHKAAKAAFDETGLKKLPKVKALNAEYSDLLTQKKAAYPDYRKAREEMQELVKAQKNIELFFAEEKDTQEKQQTR